MKIEGKVHSTSTGYEGDMIRVSPEGNDVNDVPIGAKVTVEWDENEHQCQELKNTHQSLKRDDSGRWWAVNTGKVPPQQVRILYCACCGVKLP